MQKSSLILALIIATVAAGFSAQAQSRSRIDPGISTHNYKHPNKAAQARALGDDHVIQVSSLSVVEKSANGKKGQYVSSTPKYAPRPSALVISRSYPQEGLVINPLSSPRNYKTLAGYQTKDTMGIANSQKKSDSVTFPTVD